MRKKQINRKKISILTCCLDDWGGSEELWARSIPYLQDMGNDITVYKNSFNKLHPSIKHISDQGVDLIELNPSLFFLNRVNRHLSYLFNRIIDRSFHIESVRYLIVNFRNNISRNRPDLVVISQGINFDGLHFAYECLKLNIPYVIISQKAVDFYWPQIADKEIMRQTFQNAKACYFVSYHNLHLTEEQFGVKLPNSRVIFNPIKTKRQPLKYPATTNGFNLACIGRLFIIDKGQDILIKILSQKKWRERPITVTFIGDGIDATNLKDLVNFHKLTNVKFIAYQYDIENLWLKYHALILPSRSEGLPLAITEAMAVGRPVIITNSGGNAEVVEEGITGFIGEANKYSFDDAIERAWESREKWEAMGVLASEFIQNNIPKIPEHNFAQLVNDLINEKPTLSISHYPNV